MDRQTGCTSCRDLQGTVEVRTPVELAEIIRTTQQYVRQGTIVESDWWPANEIALNRTPFLSVSDKGPWVDVLIYYFECSACQQLFQLSAESYHGAGGRWTRTDRGKPYN